MTEEQNKIVYEIPPKPEPITGYDWKFSEKTKKWRKYKQVSGV